MENLINKLKTNKNYFNKIISNTEDTQLVTHQQLDWTFFNKATIIELTLGYNIQNYKNTETLMLAQMNDEGLFIDVLSDNLYIASLESLYDKSQNTKQINQNLDSLIANIDILDNYLQSY